MKTAPASNRTNHGANNGAKRKSNHSGSSFDSFLEEHGLRQQVEAIAAKRVLAWQIARIMKQQQKTKQALARELRTSRSQLDRLLDPGALFPGNRLPAPRLRFPRQAPRRKNRGTAHPQTKTRESRRIVGWGV